MGKRYTLIFALLFISFCYAQNKSIETTINVLQKDQLLFEKVFVHTNKTKYGLDDVIWFKAYVVTNDNKPSVKTTVLYVSLFSESGELIRTKNVLIQNGVGMGQFEVFGEVEKGNYYLQANTNYMKNFGEDNKYIQKIQIDQAATNTTTNVANYDVQVFPQGGYLLENVENTIGLKALINGKSTDYTGVILDSKNKEIARFKNEHLGMSKTKFHYLSSERYQAVFKLKDTTIKVKLPEAKTTGLTINTSKTTASTLKLELQTNLKSIKQSKTNYTLLFHQNNKLIDYAAVNLIDATAVKLDIDKAGFLNGVNTITVFEGNLPVLERKFFVYKKEIKQDVAIDELANLSDSTVYKLKLKDNKVTSNISLSALPESADYKQIATIESAFLLTPYVKGYVENPAYYFNEENSKRLQYLDLLLLTQGWVEYTTEAYVNKLNPKYKYDFERGFSLSGSVTPLKSNNLGLLAKNNQVVAETFLNSTPEFEFKNLLVYKGDSIKVSFLKGAGRDVAEKPRNIAFDSLVNNKKDLMYSFQKGYEKFKKVYTKEQQVGVLNLNDINRLDEVKLKGKRKTQKGELDKAFIDKYRKQIFDLGAFYELEVSEKYIKGNLTLQTFLREQRGLTVYTDGKGITNLYKRRVSAKLYEAASLLLDGVVIRGPGEEYLNIYPFLKLEMEDIEKITYCPRGVGKRAYTRIAVFTTDNYKKGIKELFKNYVFENGYDKSKKYYSTTYGYTLDNENQEIDWKPNLRTNKLGEIDFKIKKNDTKKNCLFIVQGFTEQGQLISSIITVNASAY